MTSTILRPTSSLALLCAVAACFSAAPAWAGNDCDGCETPILSGQTTATGGGKRDALRVYAGVNWVFGAKPELVVGVRSTRTNARHKVLGGKIEAAFPVTMNSIAFDKLRVRALGGHRTAMAEAGAGYSFASKQFLLSGGMQGNHVILGTDYVFGGIGWLPFVGVNTLDKPTAPVRSLSSTGTLSCANPSQDLVPVDDIAPVTTTNQLNGYTCVEPF